MKLPKFYGRLVMPSPDKAKLSWRVRHFIAMVAWRIYRKVLKLPTP